MASCLHCSSSSPPSNGTDNFPNRPQQLAAIERCASDKHEHRLTLLDWNAQLTASSNNLSRKLSSRNSSTSNLYQILGLFFVFEGVIITAVAHATAIKCHNFWLIFTLSAIASLATFLACIQKLKEIDDAHRFYLEEKAKCSSLSNSIERLKDEGLEFDLVKGQPKLGFIHMDRYQSLDAPGFSVRVSRFLKTWVWSYTGAVFAVLLAFSGGTLAAVRLILCDPQRN